MLSAVQRCRSVFVKKRLTPLSNVDIEKLCSDIRSFRGVFMRDGLPARINQIECGVVNLDDQRGDGTHWVCYWKSGTRRIYFDSFGLPAPLEIIRYVGRPFVSQTFQLQSVGQVICGHLCVYVLKELDKGREFKNVVLSII